ncbi:MAG TPA: hypothetical protein VMN82_04990 [Thermoanaerobaculia bacterium]|nr:hypothetical protein [Thermoanaerobaculia bacterium]
MSLSQAQWLIHFMRNLPGHAPPEVHQGAYEQAMAAQQAQAHSQAAVGALPWETWQDEPDFEPY